MKESSSRMLRQLLDNRRIIIELIVVAGILSLSVNLLSSAIIDMQWLSTCSVLILAAVLFIACILYFVLRLLCLQESTHNFKGFIICRKGNHELVDCVRYNYGHNLHRYMQAMFVENEAIKKMWEKEPLNNLISYDKEAGKPIFKRGKGHQLIAEVTEYYVLERLSTHLADYFNRPEFDQHKLNTFARNDIPEVLLSNRFLELFSKPMEDRPKFSTEDHAIPHKGEVVQASGKDGVFYSRFDLSLPIGAQIKRSAPHTIVIDTNRFTLVVNVHFDGFNTVIPRQYEKFILGIDPEECQEYEVSVKFSISFKFAFIFLPGGWEYYQWIESFMESFESKFSKDKHFADIGWDAARTVIEYHEGKKEDLRKRRSREIPKKDDSNNAVL